MIARTAFQGLILLAGLALMIVGLNGSRPLLIVGLGLIVLAVAGAVLGRRRRE